MRPNIAKGAPTHLPGVDLIECPRCAIRFTFRREPVPPIDSCGFESYNLNCEQCGAELIGVIDPFDNELLIEELRR